MTSMLPPTPRDGYIWLTLLLFFCLSFAASKPLATLDRPKITLGIITINNHKNGVQFDLKLEGDHHLPLLMYGVVSPLSIIREPPKGTT